MTYKQLPCGIDVANDPRIESPMEFAQAFTGAFARLPDAEQTALSARWRAHRAVACFFQGNVEHMSDAERGCRFEFNIALVNRLPTEQLENLIAATVVESMLHFPPHGQAFESPQERAGYIDGLAEAWGFDVAALDDFVAQNMELLA